MRLIQSGFILSSILIALISSTSFAAPYTCEGQNLYPATQNNLGVAEIDLVQMTSVWAPSGSNSFPVISQATICDAPVATAECFVNDLSAPGTFKKTIACREPASNKVLATASIVFSESGMNGRVECSASKARWIYEVSNCQLKSPLTQLMGTVSPQNCVNPGGGCDGSVPCCASSVNACVRGRCQPVPR